MAEACSSPRCHTLVCCIHFRQYSLKSHLLPLFPCLPAQCLFHVQGVEPHTAIAKALCAAQACTWSDAVSAPASQSLIAVVGRVSCRRAYKNATFIELLPAPLVSATGTLPCSPHDAVFLAPVPAPVTIIVVAEVATKCVRCSV
jgi:hypothetical protein